MSSNINVFPINPDYPVAGQDNSSQGFRDNFTSIRTNLVITKLELEDLQNKVVLKSALENDVLDNNLGDNLITRAKISDFSEQVYNVPSGAGALTLDHENGHYQIISTSGAVSLAFSNWPSSGSLGRIRVAITINNVAHTVTLPAAVSLGVSDVAGFRVSTSAITFVATGTYIFEFTTADAGITIAIDDLTRARNRIQDTQLRLQQRTIANSVGSAGDTDGMIAVDDNYLYVCTGNHDGSTAIWKRVTLGATF